MMFYMSSNARVYALQRSVREPHGPRRAWLGNPESAAPPRTPAESRTFYFTSPHSLSFPPGPRPGPWTVFLPVCVPAAPRGDFLPVTVYNKDKDWGHVRCVYSERAVTVP